MTHRLRAPRFDVSLLFAMIALIAVPGLSYGYSAEQEQLCTGDAMRLCSSEIPDVDRITQCMIRQRQSLSEGCKAVFEPAEEAIAPPAAKPVRLQSKPPKAKAAKKGALAKQSATARKKTAARRSN